VLRYTSQTKSSLTRIMLDNMVIPLPNGDVDVSMLKDAVEMINGRFETEVALIISCTSFSFSICVISVYQSDISIISTFLVLICILIMSLLFHGTLL
jgi:hypothetical protein